MKNAKGFTILELMVSMVVFSMVLVMTISFYMFYGKKSAGSSVKKNAHEAATAALMSVRRDLMQAGLGLSRDGNFVRLALFVKDGGIFTSGGSTRKAPDELYISYSDFLDMDISSDKTNSFWQAIAPKDERPNSDTNTAWFYPSSGKIKITGVSAFTDRSQVDSVIFGDTVLVAEDEKEILSVDAGYSTASDAVSLDKKPYEEANNRAALSIKIPTGSSVTADVAVPAISYRVNLGEDSTLPKEYWGRLLRNGQPVIGGGAPHWNLDEDKTKTNTFGGVDRPLVKVTDFQVYCRFNIDGVDCDVFPNKCWTPYPPNVTVPAVTNTFGDSAKGFTVENLRVITVQIRYLSLDPAGGYESPSKVPKSSQFFIDPSDTTRGPWTRVGPDSMTVSPRNIVMGSYLTSSYD
ncbi:PilW family protein [Thermodesulfobacteriota bacterium]